MRSSADLKFVLSQLKNEQIKLDCGCVVRLDGKEDTIIIWQTEGEIKIVCFDHGY